MNISAPDHRTVTYNVIFPFFAIYKLSRHLSKHSHKRDKCAICQTFLVTLGNGILLIVSHYRSLVQIT